jgi:uncharacterized protein (TIGR00369 family)
LHGEEKKMKEPAEYLSHDNCFACSQHNPGGLGLAMEADETNAWCRTTVDERFQSYDGIVHGGILASIADAVMVHLARSRFGGRPMTCNLSVRYKKSVLIGEKLEARATFVRTRGEFVWAVCRISVGEDVCVEAEASLKVI